MKTKEQIIDLMTEFDKTIKIIKEWVEGKPQEPVVQAWEKEFDKKIIVDTYGAKRFIRTEVIEKIIGELEYNLTYGDTNHITDLINLTKARWLKGER